MEFLEDPSKGTTTVRAAQYVRMSTDHQRYSTENQAAAIQQYAAERGLLIVRTYADEGRSGLRLHGREALKQLIDDVTQRRADYSVVLVFDVSRWGRFQDADESAHYEFICRQAGISVRYCAEQFENDGSLQATLIKNLKRAMAAEYSRELSAKVHMGHCRLAGLGFRQGGMAGYGFRRQLLDEDRRPKAMLEFGQRKSLQTDRVTLIPGPSEEVETVRRIYQLFAYEGGNAYGIATLLNSEGRKNQFGRPWRYGLVYEILKSEKYIGEHIYNRESWKLQQFRGVNRPEDWIKVADAFEPLVDRGLFQAVQAERKRRATARTSEEMIRQLKELLSREGRLSADIINRQRGMPSSEMYRIRFGSLCKAYELAGFTPRRDSKSVSISRFIKRLRPSFVEEVTALFSRAGASVSREPLSRFLRVNDEISVSVVIVRCYRTFHGRLQWRVRHNGHLKPAITIAARMDENNERLVDYFILPHLSVGRPWPYICIEKDSFKWEAYRLSSLEPLLALFSRTEVPLQNFEHIQAKAGPRVIEPNDRRTPKEADLPVASNHLVRKRLARLGRERRALLDKAAWARNSFLSARKALDNSFADETFLALLRTEGFSTVPNVLVGGLEKRRGLESEAGEAGCVSDIVHLTIATGFLSRMVQNSRIEHHLAQQNADVLKTIRAIVGASNI